MYIYDLWSVWLAAQESKKEKKEASNTCVFDKFCSIHCSSNNKNQNRRVISSFNGIFRNINEGVSLFNENLLSSRFFDFVSYDFWSQKWSSMSKAIFFQVNNLNWIICWMYREWTKLTILKTSCGNLINSTNYHF